MAGRKRMNYVSQNNGHYGGYSSFEGGSQQLGALNPSGLGSGGGGRRGLEQSGLRRMSQQAPPYTVIDSRVGSNRSMLGPGLVSTLGAQSVHGQHLNGRSMSYGEDGLLALGGVHPYSSSTLRGPNNNTLYESYGLLPQEQVPVADGYVRTMYPSSGGMVRGYSDIGVDLDGIQSSELVGKGGMVNGYQGYMTPEDAKFGIESASQNMANIGYQGRHIVRDGRLVQAKGYDREDEAPFEPPLSSRAMPMSPRRDEIVRMMSPRRDELSPPPMSPLRDAYEDLPRMMSPRRDDLSPPINPRRRDYVDMSMMGRLRINREEEQLQHQDFPMSPRRGAGLTPPMSPRRGWDYEDLPLSPTRPTVSMRPHPVALSPPRSPLWRDVAKPPSQWDVLPSKPAVWSASDREARVGDSRPYGADIIRGAPERSRIGGDYKAEMDLTRDNYRGMGQGWSLSKKRHEGDSLYVRPEEQNGLLRPPTISGRGQMGRNFGNQSRDYGARNARPYPYNSVVNQRVGLVTKYIERERAEKIAANKATKDNIDLPNRRYNGHAGNDRAFQTDRREKDVSSAAVDFRNAKKSDKNIEGASDKTLSLVAAIEIAAKKSSVEHLDDKLKTCDKPNDKKSSNVGASAAATSAVGNGNIIQQTAAADGTPSIPSNNVQVSKAEAGKETGDAQKKDAGNTGNARQNGVTSNPASGNSQPNLKSGSKVGEPREACKRPSLVMEIERAKKSRILAGRQRHLQEVEETYYNANELSTDFISRVNRSGSRYSRMINDDPYLRRRYQGGQAGLHCLVCGKASNIFSSIYDLLTHAQGSQVQSKRIDHMGFHKALTELLKLNTKDISASNTHIKKEDERILWPPIVVMENTRPGLHADMRWDGLTNSKMTVLLHDLSHLHGRDKAIRDKCGFKDIVLVECDSSLDGLEEADHLYIHFLISGHIYKQWKRLHQKIVGDETLAEVGEFDLLSTIARTKEQVSFITKAWKGRCSRFS